MTLLDLGVKLEIARFAWATRPRFPSSRSITQAIADLAADQVDQAEHVLTGGFRLGDDEIGVPAAR